MPLNLSQYAHESAPTPDGSLIEGSPEQQAIWTELATGTSHIVVQARAGVGKSFCIVQGILRLRNITPRPRIGVFAFNKHIQEEMNTKFRNAGIDFAQALTYNSFGWRSCIRAFHPQLDDYKSSRIIREAVDERYGLDNLNYEQREEILGGTRRLVSLCKCYLYDGKSQETLEDLCDQHNVSLNGSAKLVYPLVPVVLQACADETCVMDFDDQVWQTVTKRLPVDKFDLLFVDEAQDTNLAQQELALMACPTGRVVFVGDSGQAIYGFRGADTESIPRMEARLGTSERGVKVYPMTVTRRCPYSHVALAQAIVEEIRAMDDAPEGSVECMGKEGAERAMHPGDLVLCRTNAPLVPVAYGLIRNNIKAVIRGRDVGTGLRQLIDKLRAGDSVPNLLTKLHAYHEKELAKLARLEERGEAKRQSLQDKVDCIIALCDGVNNVSSLKRKIDTIFADFDDQGKPRDAVVLGTVHRTKGLEAGTVWIIAPELLPHPMAKQTWERVQERNLAYVAVTRAKYDRSTGHEGRLVFVQGPKSQGIPAIYRQGRLAL